MELPEIPQDDFMDVMEMTNTIEAFVINILRENDRDLAMSAMMSATVNGMISQCQTLDEVMFYRNLFIQILNISIQTIQIENLEPPPPPSSS